MSDIVAIGGSAEIEAEAAAWIVQLDGGPMADQDRQALREWVGRSPQHYATLHRLADVWGELNALTALEDIAREESAEPAPAPAVGRSNEPKQLGVMAAAAAALVLVLAGLGALTIMSPPPSASALETLHSTRVGEQKSVQLADGSHIQVNTNSVVEVDYGSEERRIRLVRGEAMFKVAHDAARPFIVDAGGNSVRALGTAFAVRMEGARLEVSVAEGVVELTAPLAPEEPGESAVEDVRSHQLTALQTAVLLDGAADVRDVAESEMHRTLAWRDGMLVFQGEPLAEVVGEVSRYTPLHIVIDDAELSDLRVGGYFGVGEIDDLFKALEDGFGVRVERGDSWVRLSRAS